jgi:hypothetical protein
MAVRKLTQKKFEEIKGEGKKRILEELEKFVAKTGGRPKTGTAMTPTEYQRRWRAGVKEREHAVKNDRSGSSRK